jgi:hypothetical protein
MLETNSARRFCHWESSRSRSSGDPTRREASSFSLAAGWSSARLHGLADAAALPRTGREQSKVPRPGPSSPASACSLAGSPGSLSIEEVLNKALRPERGPLCLRGLCQAIGRRSVSFGTVSRLRVESRRAQPASIDSVIALAPAAPRTERWRRQTPSPRRERNRCRCRGRRSRTVPNTRRWGPAPHQWRCLSRIGR